jgi:hypothetical protein
VKVAEMRDGAAKAREPEPKKNEENFTRRALMSSCGRRRCCVRDFSPVDHAHLSWNAFPTPRSEREPLGLTVILAMLTVILAIKISKVDIVIQYGDCD